MLNPLSNQGVASDSIVHQTQNIAGRCHPALLIEDILRRIFLMLSLKSLVNVALTCHAWSDPALDILWEDVSLNVLLPILSPMERSHASPPLWSFTQAVTPGSWKRFDYLASRVKKTTLGQRFHKPLIAELLLSRSSRDDKPILPSLQVLATTGPACASEDLLHLPVFMGPTLRRLEMRLVESNPSLETITHMATASPTLTEFHIRASLDAIAEIIETLTNMVLSFRALTKATSWINSETWLDADDLVAAITSHPSLEEVHLIGKLSSRSQPLTSTSLSKLREIRARKGRGYTQLLRSINPVPGLLCVALHGDEKETSPIEEILEALGHHTRLEEINLDGTWSHQPFLWGSLHPIYTCSALQILSLLLRQPVANTDADIEYLAIQLPDLRSFKLGLGYRSGWKPKTTLRAYALLATSCPNLHTISMEVDATRDASCDISQPHRFLRSVEVQDSLVEDSKMVAQFLFRLSWAEDFQLSYTHRGADAIHKARKWKKVQEMVSVLHQTRADAQAANGLSGDL
ncbi:hypothetical protein FRB95_001177 [Tulasnella sp. JGI-2019a]|nr:hypothetical protein FRB95_001177 [Tulasnella sp. JGI-2019a]